MIAITGAATKPLQGCTLINPTRSRVAKAQPWAEISQRFQRFDGLVQK